MKTRIVALLALVIGGVFVSPERRAWIIRKLGLTRRFVSRRVVDRDARDPLAAWADDGGAAPTFNATETERPVR